jgi:predicted enzyme related to lactoylglutathione lyase
MMTTEQIDYLEFAAADLEATRTFFSAAFGWTFTDYGPDYIDSASGGPMVGFYRAEGATRQDSGGAVVGFYSEDLAASQARVEAAGGTILKPVYAFPGGRRFHFLEPSGNEFIVYAILGDEDAVPA